MFFNCAAKGLVGGSRGRPAEPHFAVGGNREDTHSPSTFSMEALRPYVLE